MKKENRGGIRKGAGRKPDPDKKIKLSIALTPSAVAALTSDGNTVYANATQILENWAKKQGKKKSE